MQTPVVIGDGKGRLSRLGCARFRIKHWRGTAKVEDGFSHTPEHQADPHPGTNQHCIPSKIAKFRLCVRPANPNLAESTKSKSSHGNHKYIGRRNIEPTKVCADTSENVTKNCSSLLSRDKGPGHKQD
jgi:hypothetical protein